MGAGSFSDDERRVLALIAVLLTLGAGARWLERPREVLPDVPALDVAALEEASRAARDGDADRGRGPGAGGSRGAGSPATPLDPNTATAKQLDALPGVGAATARRIVEAREQAPFRSTGDLTRVRGIGPATLARWKGLLTLPEGPPSDIPAQAQDDPAPAEERRTPRSRSGGATPGRAGPAGPASPADAVTAGVEPARPVNLNSASEQELQQLRGIGPALARRIIARRDSLYRFDRWEQVDSIPGVGPALLATLQATAVLQ